MEAQCELVANHIHAGTMLRGTSMIKKALMGRETFMYSGQLLNRPSLESKIAELGRVRRPQPV